MVGGGLPDLSHYFVRIGQCPPLVFGIPFTKWQGFNGFDNGGLIAENNP